ncbi:Flp pilus assembly complex ATPase component TadA [Pyxidicoccus fallax]|uniref:Flp pilus assembly complex ATPase component TadA n=1 Tax=Pyxidicoccus fallax TaxID=394095 RepID=A0A848LR31_9BACT|nr:ATPase, T2SS/T4P/T4SS family [Pyxidicoccus fallax]NMO20013.1 Flp pilus assembly complex ATPase component TadA [Pyxidicoccus fallax]NPC80747.1 Flp pilus assembly complex ATPase component TadA [Pyxidicoccus fallax]
MSESPAPIAGVITRLLDALAEAGRRVPEPPPSPVTLDDGAAALFSIAGQAGATLFSVWAEEEETGGVASGISLFFSVPDEAGARGLLGTQREAVRVRSELDLYRPLGEAISSLANRGADSRRPERGGVPFPLGASDPDIDFRVHFADGALGTWVTAVARDRRTRAAFPSFRELPMSTEDAVSLDELFFELSALFNGQPVLFSGERGSGRTTTLHAAMEALPDNVRGLAVLDEPRALDSRIGMTRPGEAGMLGTLRAFLRQDPDVVLADEVRTPEELAFLLQSALTGHATLAVIEAPTPEAALARLREAMPELPVSAFIVHHTRDAKSGARTITLHR